MRKIIAYEYVTLDGVMELPEKWQFPYLTGDTAEFNMEQALAPEVSLLGRVTYEAFAEFWPLQTHNEFGLADKFNSMPKFVVSSSLKNAAWQNSTIISGDVADEISRLKQASGGDIGVAGSATLVQWLGEHRLIDEYRLLVHPIVLGSGKRLFKDGAAPHPLRLLETRLFTSGVVYLSYAPVENST